MKLKFTSLMVIIALSVSACSNNGAGRFGLGGGSGGDLTAGGLGSVDDPTSAAYFNQTIGDRVLFAVDESSLGAEARLVLDAQANWLLTNTEFSAVIEGHADEQGTREYNIALSDRRANSVKEYLVSKGVSPARLETVPFGKERPLAICSEESCYSQNRRAVTVLGVASLG